MNTTKLKPFRGFPLQSAAAKLGLLAACLFLSQVSLHADVLIGGTIGNGNFDAGATGWVTTGTYATVNINSSNGPGTGNNAVIGLDAAYDTIFFGKDTGHTLALGDRFEGGFSWIPKKDWDNNGEGIDDGPVSMHLFYTDTNAIGGARTVITTWDSGLFSEGDPAEDVDFPLTTAFSDAPNVGKTLFVSFETNGQTVNNRYARVDDVTLSVTVIPEPSALVLIGLAGISALLLRRRC